MSKRFNIIPIYGDKIYCQHKQQYSACKHCTGVARVLQGYGSHVIAEAKTANKKRCFIKPEHIGEKKKR
jgi:hypothetical protein